MRMTLAEVLKTCTKWVLFCNEKGWSVHAVSEGGGQIEVELTLAEASYYGILREDIDAGERPET